MCVLNMMFNLSYYFFNHRFLFRRTVPFFSFPRILVFFLVSQIL
jgi:hypothetical protein